MATICVVLQSGLKSWLNMVTTTVSLYKRVPRQKMCTLWKKRISRVLIFAHPSCAKIVSLIFAHLFCAKINVTRNLGKVRQMLLFTTLRSNQICAFRVDTFQVLITTCAKCLYVIILLTANLIIIIGTVPSLFRCSNIFSEISSSYEHHNVGQ